MRRKVLHLATALVPVGYHYGVPRLWLVGALGLGTVVAFAVEWLRRRHPVVARTFTAWVGALLRPAEQEALTGATWLCLSCFLVVVWCPAPVAIAAMWCATIGDPAAAIIGRALSSEGGRKTWAGSIACASFSAIGVWWLIPLAPWGAAAVGVVAALAERPALPLDDNLRVTVATGAVTALLS